MVESSARTHLTSSPIRTVAVLGSLAYDLNMRTDLKPWAEAGARARLDEIHSEATRLLRAFPDLRPASYRRAMERAGRTAAAPVRRRRRMSAAERKAVGERMRKYWAARRESKAAGGRSVKKR
jgi:hypothetical protein